MDLQWMFDNHPHVMTAIGLTIGGALSVAIIAVYDVVTEIDFDLMAATVADRWHGWQIDIKAAFAYRGNYE